MSDTFVFHFSVYTFLLFSQGKREEKINSKFCNASENKKTMSHICHENGNKLFKEKELKTIRNDKPVEDIK